jgi:hypothetical protein
MNHYTRMAEAEERGEARGGAEYADPRIPVL